VTGAEMVHDISNLHYFYVQIHSINSRRACELYLLAHIQVLDQWQINFHP